MQFIGLSFLYRASENIRLSGFREVRSKLLRQHKLVGLFIWATTNTRNDFPPFSALISLRSIFNFQRERDRET